MCKKNNSENNITNSSIEDKSDDKSKPTCNFFLVVLIIIVCIVAMYTVYINSQKNKIIEKQQQQIDSLKICCSGGVPKGDTEDTETSKLTNKLNTLISDAQKNTGKEFPENTFKEQFKKQFVDFDNVVFVVELKDPERKYSIDTTQGYGIFKKMWANYDMKIIVLTLNKSNTDKQIVNISISKN